MDLQNHSPKNKPSVTPFVQTGISNFSSLRGKITALSRRQLSDTRTEPLLILFRPTFAIAQDYFTMCLDTIYQLTIIYLSTGLVPRCQHFWFFQLKRKLSFNLLIHLGCRFLGIRTHHVGTLLPTLVSWEFHLNPTRFSEHTPMVVTDL